MILMQPLTIITANDIVAVQVFDIKETGIPDVGLIKLKDAETGERIWIEYFG